MSSSEAASRAEERLLQLLKILDTFCSESTAAELQKLANEAKRVVTQMRNALERVSVEQVVQLVQAKQWDKAILQMNENFPARGSLKMGRVEEVLELIFLSNNLDNVSSAIMWVGQLDVQFQLRAYEALYHQFLQFHWSNPKFCCCGGRSKCCR